MRPTATKATKTAVAVLLAVIAAVGLGRLLSERRLQLSGLAGGPPHPPPAPRRAVSATIPARARRPAARCAAPPRDRQTAPAPAAPAPGEEGDAVGVPPAVAAALELDAADVTVALEQKARGGITITATA